MSDEQLDLLIPELKLLFLVIKYQKKEYEDDMLKLLSESQLQIGNQLATLLSSITYKFVEIPEEGGTVRVCESTKAIKERFRNEGEAIGSFKTALSLFLDESISAEKAAKLLGMSVEQFLAKAKVQMS